MNCSNPYWSVRSVSAPKTSRLLPFLFCVTVVLHSPAAPIRFRNATDSAGIRFIHTDGSSGKHYIVETVASGLGLIDYDGDGYPDILFLNGSPLPGSPERNPTPSWALYRNNGNGTFQDVTPRSGLGISDYAVGCAVADYDNDGHEDVFVTCFGGQHLFHNNGDGTFTDATAKAGLADPGLKYWIGAGCVFLDYDRDGFLDLFVSYYLEFDPAQNKPSTRSGIPNYVGPGKYRGLPSRLYHNNHDGTFTDVSASAGIAKHNGYGMGVVSADFDGDGWPDIYVGNDVMQNFLFHNKRDGTFDEIGVAAGVGYDGYGEPQGTMGVNVGDYDGDGLFDIFVTKYQDQVNTLYRNLGHLQFRDVTVQTAAGINSRHLVTWGCGIVDFDNDGISELFAAAGHLQDTVEEYDKSTTYKQRSLLLRREGGRFVDITSSAGDLASLAASSRGAVFGDLNNDGKIDIVLLNSRSRATLLLNETPTANHWTLLKLTGTRSNVSGVGARVRLTAGGRRLVDEVRSGRGYQSAEDLRLHFGLGTNALIQRLEVYWPSGITNTWTNLPTDKVLRLEEASPPPGS